MSNLPQPVDCDNANCHLNAHNVRYWMDACFSNDSQYATEVEKRIRRDGNIIDLNREVEKLRKDLQDVRDVFSEFYEPRLQALQKVKDTLDKYVVTTELPQSKKTE